MSKLTVLITTGPNTWTVPSDWNSSANSIECIGGGGAGATAATHVGSGGEGGHYAKVVNHALTPGATINYNVGKGGNTTNPMVIGVAVNSSTKKIWFGNPVDGSGLWNHDNLTNQNPATGAGGISYSVITGALFPTFSPHSNETVTINGGNNGLFQIGLPAGFSALDMLAGATTTWNPSDKDTSITLSNSNFTAAGGGVGYRAVRATQSFSSGLAYFEFIVNNQSGSNEMVVGASNASFGLSSYIGNDTNSIGYQGSSGNVIYNNSGSPATLASYSAATYATAGGSTFFNGTTLAGSTVGALGGAPGTASSSPATTATTNDVGTTIHQGGEGAGIGADNEPAAGGGGAAGPGGVGGNGAVPTSSVSGGGGGAGDTGGAGGNASGITGGASGDGSSGGTGGTSPTSGTNGAGGGGGQTPANAAAGSSGNDSTWQFSGNRGPGGGGGGGGNSGGGGDTSGGAGGLYGGGGGGGAYSGANSTGGNGAQGIIIILNGTGPITAFDSNVAGLTAQMFFAGD